MIRHSIQGEAILHTPTIHAERCLGCKACIKFCRNGVLEFDEKVGIPRVKSLENCPAGCRTCAWVCPTNAIIFVDEEAFIAYLKEKLDHRNGGPP